MQKRKLHLYKKARDFDFYGFKKKENQSVQAIQTENTGKGLLEQVSGSRVSHSNDGDDADDVSQLDPCCDFPFNKRLKT